MKRKGTVLKKVTDEDIKNGTFIIPSGITKIGDDAFKYCKNLIDIIIPESVREIGCRAFEYCTNLKSITISKSVKKIGYGAFADCTKLIDIAIPEGVEEIEFDTFKMCSSLTSITIPKSITEIGYGVFNNCKSLTNITISEGVQLIGPYAFSACSSLKDITIPQSVTIIGADIFYCSNLQNINIYSYEIFTQLDEKDKPVAVISSIKNDCTGKIKYKEKDIDNMVYSFDDIDSLIKMTIEAEIRTILLEYANKLRSQKSVADIFNEKYDLDKYLNETLDDESFQKKKK